MIAGTSLDDFYAFDISTATWKNLTAVGDAPSPRSYLSMTSANGRIFVFGGAMESEGGVESDISGMSL